MSSGVQYTTRQYTVGLDLRHRMAGAFQSVVDYVTSARTAKPITVYGDAKGPNAWKVIMIMEELGVAYDHKQLSFPEMKLKEYTDVNPNGRVPAIQDPNTGLTIWESGAIIEYLIETYDKSNIISYKAGTKERWEEKQWLYFQVSGQGPYFGQLPWFVFAHEEKNLTSVIERYTKEVERVIGVIDSHLAKRETAAGGAGASPETWLVGDRCTYADIAFVTWNIFIKWPLGDKTPAILAANPRFAKWEQELLQRPAIGKVIRDWKAAGAPVS